MDKQIPFVLLTGLFTTNLALRVRNPRCRMDTEGNNKRTVAVYPVTIRIRRLFRIRK